jgi:hypothetical protein
MDKPVCYSQSGWCDNNWYPRRCWNVPKTSSLAPTWKYDQNWNWRIWRISQPCQKWNLIMEEWYIRFYKLIRILAFENKSYLHYLVSFNGCRDLTWFVVSVHKSIFSRRNWHLRKVMKWVIIKLFVRKIEHSILIFWQKTMININKYTVYVTTLFGE